MHNFRQLEVWKRSYALALEVFKLVGDLPKEERFGLRSQITRSVVSISSNIAEGSSRGSDKEFGRFLEISIGSAFELETQIQLSVDLSLVETVRGEQIIKEVREIQQMIAGLRKRL